MKNKKILFIFVITIFFVSCKKELENISVSKDSTVGNVTKKILNFEKKLIGAEKSQFYPTDSAIWYLEGLLNFRMNQIDTIPYETIIDSSKINIQIQNDSVSISQLALAYAKIRNELLDKILQKKNYDKIIAIDIYQNELKNNNEFSVYAIIGNSFNYWPGPTFGPTDYWFCGGNAGQCGDYVGLGDTLDATDKLKQYLMTRYIEYPPNCNVYYTDVELDPNTIFPEMYPDPNAPNLGYRLFQDYEDCIPPDYLNYYLTEGIPYIIDDNAPIGKEIIDFNLFCDVIIGYPTISLHAMNHLYWGVKHIDCSSNPTE